MFIMELFSLSDVQREMVQSLLARERRKVGMAPRELTSAALEKTNNNTDWKKDHTSLQLNTLTLSATSPTPMLDDAKERDLDKEEAETVQRAVTQISSVSTSQCRRCWRTNDDVCVFV